MIQTAFFIFAANVFLIVLIERHYAHKTKLRIEEYKLNLLAKDFLIENYQKILELDKKKTDFDINQEKV